MSEEVKLLQPLQYITAFLDQKIRSDGRKFNEFRPILLNSDTIGTADGSAMIRLGNSALICGITNEIIEPNSETPDEGCLTITVKLPALCSAKYSMNDSTNDALVLTQMLRNVINKSKIIDCKQLCISEAKFAWNLNIEVICLNNDGNVFDLCLSAIVAALHSCSVQSVVLSETNQISYEEQRKPLKLSAHPIATSFAVIDGIFLSDPSIDEQSLADSVLHIVVNADDDAINLFEMSGSTKVESTQLEECFKIAKRRSKTVKNLILELSSKNYHKK